MGKVSKGSLKPVPRALIVYTTVCFGLLETLAGQFECLLVQAFLLYHGLCLSDRPLRFAPSGIHLPSCAGRVNE